MSLFPNAGSAFTDSAGQPSQTFALGIVTAHSTIVAYAKYGTATSVFGSVTDNLGNTYVEIDSAVGGVGGINTMKTFVATDVVGGSCIVSLNFVGSTGVFPRLSAVEVTGCVTDGTLVHAHEIASQTTPGTATDAVTSAGSATISVPCVVIAMVVDHDNVGASSSHSVADGTNFVGVINNTTGPNYYDVGRVSYRVELVSGAMHATFTDANGAAGNFDTYTTAMIALKLSPRGLFSESFTGANANPIGGNWTTNTGFAAIQRISNAADGSSGDSAAYVTGVSTLADSHAKVKFIGTAVTTDGGPFVRGDPAAVTHYLLDLPTMQLYYVHAGTYTTIGSSSAQTFTTNDTAELVVVGSFLFGLRNDVVQVRAIDTNLTTGRCGVFMSGTSIRFSNYDCGDYGPVTAAVFPPELLGQPPLNVLLRM